ncbi:DUF3093 domain-containing protein [Streptomyces sp. NBC_00687]|uniref:DUF3093 domain-containing protein n=1 Tax=Streptomyces sp. NBC_00687 TaxID=2975807 RepID=UPI00224E3F27|nr:DUF3093 domain-containing protein [Streptomyces sp. NBC_00687]MCX4920025.1 DUF3093 domain-containing protein [Streptomyces sp. NBC_00687]
MNNLPSPDVYDKVNAVATYEALAYDERLTAPRAYWVIAVSFGLSLGLVFLPYGLIAALCALTAGTCVAGFYVSSQGSLRIRVVGDFLIAGDARIPLNTLGEPQVLKGEEARAWRTYKADMRAFMLMRSYISTAVRIEVLDPDDPTPYLYLSTRTPDQLASVLRHAL